MNVKAKGSQWNNSDVIKDLIEMGVSPPPHDQLENNLIDVPVHKASETFAIRSTSLPNIDYYRL